MKIQKDRLGDQLIFEPGDRVTARPGNGPGTVTDPATLTREELIKAIGTYFGDDWQLVRFDNGYVAPVEYFHLTHED